MNKSIAWILFALVLVLGMSMLDMTVYAEDLNVGAFYDSDIYEASDGTYSIKYVLNGGTNNKKNPVEYNSTSKTISLKKPSRKGYTFAGWYRDKKFKKKITRITKGSTGTKTVYAKWIVNKYTIRFDGNGADSGTMNDKKGCKYDKKYKLSPNRFARTGYTFAGWNTKADGSGKTIADKATASKLLSKNGGVKTLYAMWKADENMKCPDNVFDYLAIGNSITKHPLYSYWWNECGMAATSSENDYVHLVADHLKKTYGDVCFEAIHFGKWETQAQNRRETYGVIDPYLSTKLDMVTIQLSENVTDITAFEEDFEDLIRYIKQRAPCATILVIDDFWDNDKKESLKKEACSNTNVIFLSLDDIKGKEEYQCGLGTVVYDPEGGGHVVEHNGVAVHPGNKGMRYIADIIIGAIENGA
jgi:uncharacterized repeat protein (TIGR02543 family)